MGMTPKLVGLCGFKGSGKDESARAIVGSYGPFKQIAFADPIREICELVFGLTAEEMADRELKETKVDRYPYDSPRHLMQKIGTECFRSLWPDVWIEAAMRRVTETSDPVVITDVRFPNECGAIKKAGGLMVRVIRSDQDAPSDLHPSERHINQLPVDFEIIAKTGEIELLHRQLRMLCGLPTQLTEEDL